MRRFPDWQARLARFIAHARMTPPAWGSADCFMFACNGILAITGEDLAAEFRGKYASRFGALKTMVGFSGRGGLEAGVDRLALRHGMARVPIAYAQTGDLVLFEPPPGQDAFGGMLSISIGRSCALMSTAGLSALPTLSGALAWHAD